MFLCNEQGLMNLLLIHFIVEYLMTMNLKKSLSSNPKERTITHFFLHINSKYYVLITPKKINILCKEITRLKLK